MPVVVDITEIPRELIAVQEEVKQYIVTFFIIYCHSCKTYPKKSNIEHVIFFN